MQRSRMKRRWRRRVITDKKEIDVIQYEQRDDALRVHLEKKEEKEKPRWDDDKAGALKKDASEENWTPPKTFAGFYALARETWPDLSLADTITQAKMLQMRMPIVEKAFLDGLAMGRELNERTRYGLGWLPWPSLEECLPREREVVMAKIRKVIERDVSLH